MQIILVTYTKTFNLGNYSSEKIGVEIAINEGEDAKEALSTAKQLVEEYHQQSMATYGYGLPSNDIITNPNTFTTEPLPIIQTSVHQPEVREQTLEEQIRSCTDITVLKAYQLLVKKDPILQKAYDDTMATIKFHKL